MGALLRVTRSAYPQSCSREQAATSNKLKMLAPCGHDHTLVCAQRRRTGKTSHTFISMGCTARHRLKYSTAGRGNEFQVSCG